jgi:hypothetical protein
MGGWVKVDIPVLASPLVSRHWGRRIRQSWDVGIAQAKVLVKAKLACELRAFESVLRSLAAEAGRGNQAAIRVVLSLHGPLATNLVFGGQFGYVRWPLDRL